MKIRFAVLLSGSGTNLQALIDSVDADAMEIALVISNRADAYGLHRAQAAGIPTLHIGHKGKPREVYDQELVEQLQDHSIDWVFLAGFMRVLSPVFLNAFVGRVVNIHPALLPSFPGLHGQQQAFDAGVCIAGATVHFVDAGVDTGPIIAQGALPVSDSDDADSLQKRILAIEHRLFPMVMRWAAEGRLSCVDGKACVALAHDERRYLWSEG